MRLRCTNEKQSRNIQIKRNGVRRNTYENDNPSTKVITGKTAKALNELVRTTSIIAIKTALWQFSKNSYCVLVHGPRLKSKKLTKCDSRKLKFHTKPHNNHTQDEKREDLFPSWSSFLFMHVGAALLFMHVGAVQVIRKQVLRAVFFLTKGAFLNSLDSRRRRKEKSKKLGFFKNGSRRIRRYFADVKQNEAPKGPRS